MSVQLPSPTYLHPRFLSICDRSALRAETLFDTKPGGPMLTTSGWRYDPSWTAETFRDGIYPGGEIEFC